MQNLEIVASKLAQLWPFIQIPCNYGNNLRRIANLYGENKIEDLSTVLIKNNVKYRKLPMNEEWRIPILEEMLFARENNITLEGLTRRDMNHIINYVCTI